MELYWAPKIKHLLIFVHESKRKITIIEIVGNQSLLRQNKKDSDEFHTYLFIYFYIVYNGWNYTEHTNLNIF
jgi:hypothetical protein